MRIARSRGQLPVQSRGSALSSGRHFRPVLIMEGLHRVDQVVSGGEGLAIPLKGEGHWYLVLETEVQTIALKTTEIQNRYQEVLEKWLCQRKPWLELVSSAIKVEDL